jgi:hypothetical protein
MSDDGIPWWDLMPWWEWGDPSSLWNRQFIFHRGWWEMLGDEMLGDEMLGDEMLGVGGWPARVMGRFMTPPYLPIFRLVRAQRRNLRPSGQPSFPPPTFHALCWSGRKNAQCLKIGNCNGLIKIIRTQRNVCDSLFLTKFANRMKHLCTILSIT